MSNTTAVNSTEIQIPVDSAQGQKPRDTASKRFPQLGIVFTEAQARQFDRLTSQQNINTDADLTNLTWEGAAPQDILNALFAHDRKERQEDQAERPVRTKSSDQQRKLIQVAGLLEAQAGTGKTHLFLDSARRKVITAFEDDAMTTDVVSIAIVSVEGILADWGVEVPSIRQVRSTASTPARQSMTSAPPAEDVGFG